MSEIHDDRRLDPRFPTSGEASFGPNGTNYRAALLDLSLNGLRVIRPEGFALDRGTHVQLALSFPEADHFSAEAVVVHIEDTQIGLEFHAMGPRDFAVLVALIERHWQERVKRQLNA
jgi:hypothetical protein